MTLFSFINCQGYSIQGNSDLLKITSAEWTIKSKNTVLYLLDAAGTIRCTLLQNQYEYERLENFDRRAANVANGFTVVWENETTCKVSRPPREKNHINRIALIFISSIIGIIVISALIWGINNLEDDEEDPDITIEETLAVEVTDTVPIEIIEATDQENAETKITIVDPTPEVKEQEEDAFYKDKIIIKEKQYIKALYNDNCTKETVNEAEKWYNSLGINKQYATKIARYITAYNMFFNASGVKDMKVLYTSYRDCFSTNQKQVILEYGRSTHQFKEWISKFGMSFSKPWVCGVMQ